MKKLGTHRKRKYKQPFLFFMSDEELEQLDNAVERLYVTGRIAYRRGAKTHIVREGMNKYVQHILTTK